MVFKRVIITHMNGIQDNYYNVDTQQTEQHFIITYVGSDISIKMPILNIRSLLFDEN